MEIVDDEMKMIAATTGSTLMMTSTLLIIINLHVGDELWLKLLIIPSFLLGVYYFLKR